MNTIEKDIVYVDKFLGDDEIRKLIDSIQIESTNASMNNIKRIILRGNCIGPTGAGIIASLLKNQYVTINLLSLEWNQILSDGLIKLAEALEGNKRLTHLDVRNNNINDDGAIFLAKILCVNTTLRVLDMRWNQITDKGMLSFRESLLTRQPPIKLLYHGNVITENTRTSLDIWSDGNDVLNESKNDDAPHTNSQCAPSSEIAGNAQNDILNKELIELRKKLSNYQTHIHD